MKTKSPPGYMDELKTQDKYMHYDVPIDRKFGDLIIWNEILDEMKNSHTRSVIFVTDDHKEDWWWFIKSEGKKTLGPRPELIHEIMEIGNIENFWMYDLERFLRFASDHLDIKLKKGSVESVREVARVHSEARPRNIGRLAEQAVKGWLLERFDNVEENKSLSQILFAPIRNPDLGMGLQEGAVVRVYVS